MGQVVVEALTGYPTQRLTNEIKTRVDAITTFPTDAERPVVTELIYRHLLGTVQLAGDLDEWELKELGETLRDDLARQPWISVVDLVSPRRYEVSINVSEIDLRRHNLSFDDVVRAIQSTSLNLPPVQSRARMAIFASKHAVRLTTEKISSKSYCSQRATALRFIWARSPRSMTASRMSTP